MSRSARSGTGSANAASWSSSAAHPPVKCVPAEFVHDGELIKGLFGALTVLADAGYSPEESLRWLLTDEPLLPGRPVDLMAEGRHHAVKRRAMTLAF